MMPILPQPGQPPVFPGHGQMYTAVMLAFGIMTALHHRRRTGEGQQVDTSLLAGKGAGAGTLVTFKNARDESVGALLLGKKLA